MEGFASHKLDGARLQRLEEERSNRPPCGLSEEVDALWGPAWRRARPSVTHPLHFRLRQTSPRERREEKEARAHPLPFDDLLKTPRARVSGPQANRPHHRPSGRYDVALIDEFQDTDPVQWEIFEAVFTGPGRRMIVVGDPKQAIYAFRGADIQTYLSAPAITR